MTNWKASLKVTATFVALLVPAVLLLSCGGDGNETPEASLPLSTNGYELYSWFGGPDWHYALFVGDDRVKTFDEISARDVRIEGTAGLIDVLSRLPEGEQVLWSTELVPGTTLPPVKTIEEVSRFCSSNKIWLEIAD
jgi:hypothetical protein